MTKEPKATPARALPRKPQPAERKIRITPEYLTNLRAHILRTRVSAHDIVAYGRGVLPKGLTPTTGANWLIGTVKYAKPSHMRWMEAAYESLDDKAPVMQAEVALWHGRMPGTQTLAQIFAKAGDVPHGLSLKAAENILLGEITEAPDTWQRWLSRMFARSGAPSNLEALLIKHSKTPNFRKLPQYTWKNEDRDRLAALIVKTDVSLEMLFATAAAQHPKGLNAGVARDLMRGTLKESPYAYYSWLRSVYKRLETA